MLSRAERHSSGFELSFNRTFLFNILGGLRALVFYGLISLACVASSVLILPASLFGCQRFARWVNHIWAGFFLEAGRLVCGLNYQVEGLENRPSCPCVFLVRHESAWETIALQYFLPEAVIVFKHSLIWVPFFGLNLLALRFIPVARHRCIQAVKTVLRLGKARLQTGRSIVFFPEGTRVAPNAFPAFYRAGTYLAVQAKVAVVPICHNAGSFWGRNQLVKQPGTIHLKVGSPIYVESHTAEALNQQAYVWIKTTRLAMYH